MRDDGLFLIVVTTVQMHFMKNGDLRTDLDTEVKDFGVPRGVIVMGVTLAMFLAYGIGVIAATLFAALFNGGMFLLYRHDPRGLRVWIIILGQRTDRINATGRQCRRFVIE
jgi:hypothetical protein